MNKLILYIILVGIVSCNKSQPINEPNVEEQIVDTLEVPQDIDTLTEKERWKLFDEFWVEFQSAVINDDTVKLKEMSDLPENESRCSYNTDELLKFLKKNKIKKIIKNCNKKNKYNYHYKDRYIEIFIEVYFTKPKFRINMCFNGCGVNVENIDVVLVNNKCKIVKYAVG